MNLIAFCGHSLLDPRGAPLTRLFRLRLGAMRRDICKVSVQILN